MKQILTSLFILGITFTSFSQTQMEMNQVINEKYLKADKELNRVYNQILIDYQDETNFLEKLKSSQRLWIKFRDAELEMKFPEPSKRLYYGSMYAMCESGYLEQLTKERTKKLKEWLQPFTEGEGCVGSIKFREVYKKDFSINRIENFEFEKLLNEFEILNEFKTSELSIRIIALGNVSGSAGFANGEITHDLFFAISEFDEYPKQNLFRVSEFYNPKIESMDSASNTKQIIEIHLEN